MNTSILDQIIDATPASIPSQAIQPVTITQAPPLYRGFAKPVEGTQLTTEDILAQTGLNWKVFEFPVLIQGKLETRPFASRKALVRGDNGDPIEIVSNDFKAHQNAEIVGGLTAAINAIGAKVSTGGYLPESGRVFLTATADAHFDSARGTAGGPKVGDVTRLEFVVSGGHKPGTPLSVRAVARRLRCLNGLTVAVLLGAVGGVTHRRSITPDDLRRIAEWAEGAVRQFWTLGSEIQRLQNIPAPRSVQQAVILDTIAPDTTRRILGLSEAASGSQILADIIEREERFYASQQDVNWLLSNAANQDIQIPRVASQVINALDSQAGREYSAGTLAHAVNAASYFVDHVRGRQGGAAVESSILGDGDRLKNSALATAVRYADRLQAVRN